MPRDRLWAVICSSRCLRPRMLPPVAVANDLPSKEAVQVEVAEVVPGVVAVA